MPQVDIDGLSFTFPDLWIVGKYDDWAFYRTRWLRTRPESKAVDVIAMAPDRTVWLIEVEDYNHPNTEPPSALPDTVARKIFDTLAALSTEAKALRVVLPMEQWPQAVRLADIRQKLKQRLRPVDRYPLASGIEWPNGVLWEVARSDAMP